MTSARQSIALLVRIRNEWELLRGLVESLAGVIDEVWVFDDHSDVPMPRDLMAGLPLTVLRAREWSLASDTGPVAEGRQRDRLLQEAKRASRCAWALQLDADERLSDPAALRQLAASAETDGWVLPLVDFYITPADAALSDARHPERVRSLFGPETRWTLAMFRLLPPLYVSRGDVREPQGLAASRVRRAPAPVIEHFGKSISVEEWERKVDHYVDRYPAYRDKWEARRGRAVHDGVSDFGAPLLRRGGATYDPDTAEVVYAYPCERGWKPALKSVLFGRLGALTNTLPVDRVR